MKAVSCTPQAAPTKTTMLEEDISSVRTLETELCSCNSDDSSGSLISAQQSSDEEDFYQSHEEETEQTSSTAAAPTTSHHSMPRRSRTANARLMRSSPSLQAMKQSVQQTKSTERVQRLPDMDIPVSRTIPRRHASDGGLLTREISDEEVVAAPTTTKRTKPRTESPPSSSGRSRQPVISPKTKPRRQISIGSASLRQCRRKRNSKSPTPSSLGRLMVAAASTATQKRGLPKKSKSSDCCVSLSPKRSPVRSIPRRTKSGTLSDLASRLALPNIGQHRRHHPRREMSQTPESELNLFGDSDLITTNFLLSQIDHAKKHKEICRLELEDVLDRRCDENDPEDDGSAIPLALRELFLQDDREWESVHFANDINDELTGYKPFMERRQKFWNHLDDVLEDKGIPYSIETRVNVNIVSSPSTSETIHMLELLLDLQSDPTVTVLNIIFNHVTQSLIHSVTHLMRCDDRKWERVILKFSCDDEKKKGKAIQNAMERMDRVAKERSIPLIIR